MDAACENVDGLGKSGTMADDKSFTQDDTLCAAESNGPLSTDASAAGEPPPHPQPHLYHFGPEPEESYFALRHLHRLPARDTSSATSTESSPSPSVHASSTSVHLTYGHTGTISRPTSALDGHSDHSRATGYVQSHETSTNTTLGHTTNSKPSQASIPLPSHNPTKRLRDYPVYPNQAFSVLHTQFHPTNHLPRPLRTRSSHPSQHTSYSACTSPRPGSDHAAMGPLGSKTVGNTPASSPGLYTPPASAPLERVISDDGSRTSAFLHFTHKQQPKETHKAEIDRDPISGRKWINQYEMVDEIGRGSHGKVKLGRELKANADTTERNVVAIKIVGRYSKKRRLGKLGNAEDNVKKEVAILKKARHPHVVALLEVIDDPDKAKVYLILEYVELGEIIWRTKGVKEIVVIERRRFERGALGLEDTASTQAEDERLIKIAKSRFRFEERRRIGSQNPDTTQDYWSLEHGGASEDEPIDASYPAIPTSEQIEAGPFESDNENDARRLRQSNLSGSVFEERSTPSSVTALEESMHGVHPTEQTRCRTASVVDSLISYPSTDAVNDPFEEEYSYVPTLTMQRARQAFRDTMLGLEFLHYQGIIHRDIKPANLLWTKEHVVKISDFGVSYLGKPLRENEKGDEVSESDATTLDEAVELAKTVGTPAFYAPELCYTDLTAPRPSITGQIDVWALGVTLYCILFARVPFLAADEFTMFKAICEDKVIIPRKRLLAVDTSPQGPSSSSHIRQPTDLLYEDIEDDLYDLLSRLLVKDPAKRITLKEIKHHPWVLHGIKDPEKWLEETDPSRQSHGKRIEVSNEEVSKAVVPLTLIGRMKSNLKKTFGNFGLGHKGRKRAKSGSNSGFTSEEGPTSPSIPATRSVRDERRTSLREDEAITLALKGSREPSGESDHPLAQSVVASPEMAKEPSFFYSGIETTLGDMAMTSQEDFSSNFTLPRPNPPERALSATSTAESTKTIVPYSPNETLAKTPSSHSPGLPETPIAVDTAGGNSLGAIFGGAGRWTVKETRSKGMLERGETSRSSRRPPSVDRVAISLDDQRGEPSVAISNTLAAGHVDPPEALRDISPTTSSDYASPTSSRSPVVDSVLPNLSEQVITRVPSIPSSSSTGRPTTAPADERRGSIVSSSHDTALRSPLTATISPESAGDAQIQQERRRQMELQRSRHRPASAVVFDTGNILPGSYPPSPDEVIFFNKQLEDDAHRQRAAQETLLPASYHSYESSAPVMPTASSSSDDYFTSEVSRPTSVPSVPSIISANSSVIAEETSLKVTGEEPISQRRNPDQAKTPTLLYSISPEAPALAMDDEAGYNGDGDGAHEEEEEDSDSDEDFLSMPQSRSREKSRSESVSIAESLRGRPRSGTQIAEVMKTDESGSSTGTVKKVRRAKDQVKAEEDVDRGRTLSK